MRTDFSFFRLAFGVLCIAAATITIVGDVDGYRFEVAWLWVAALTVIGVAGITSVLDSIRGSRRDDEVTELDDDGTTVDV